jgi:hypothetical protein
MILDISHDIKLLTTVSKSSIVPNGLDEYDSTGMGYKTTGWGYLSDDYDTADVQKRNIVTTLLSPIVNSETNKIKFFTANNIVLMGTKTLPSRK